VFQSANLQTHQRKSIQTRFPLSMPSSKESPADADNRTNSWLDSNQSFMVPPVVNSKDISVSVKETLNSSMTMSNETHNISFPSFSEEIPVIAGNTISKSSLDSDQSTTAMPVTNSQYTGVSVNETLNSAMTNEIDNVSMLSFSQETPAKSDKPAINSLDPDLSSMDPLVTNSQNTDSINETLNSSSSVEKDKVCMLSPSRGSPVIADNPIDKNSSESDQSLLAPPSADSQYIIFSVKEAWNSAMSDGTARASMPSSSDESLVITDDQLIEKSLDSDLSSMEPLVTNSQVTSVSIKETRGSTSSNEKDKVCMPSSSGSPVSTDNPIDENSSGSDQSMLASPSTNSQYIIFSVDESQNSAMGDGMAKVSMPSSFEASLVIADDRLVENSLDSDQTSTEPLVTNSQVTSVPINETPSAASSNEKEKVCMPSSSGGPVDTDNPITENSSESDQSLLAPPPSTNSQDISVSVNETPNSAMSNGTTKLSMPSSEESLVTADDRLVENSLDSDQFFMVLPERKSQDIGISVSETSNSSSNETDKVSNPSYSTESPVVADNPIGKNSLDSDQSLTAPPVTKSQDTGMIG